MTVKLEKPELVKCWLRWITYGQHCYNYQNMQGMGFCNSMLPIIDKLYPNDPIARAEAMKRHLVYYNTENNWGAVINGLTCSMEEEKANGAEINDATINSVKAALMGPIAGVGDTVTQSVVKTILLGIGCDLAVQGNSLGPILFFVGMSAYCIVLSNRLFFLGYNQGKASISKLLSSGKVGKITEALSALGMVIIGSLVCTAIGVTTPLTFSAGVSSPVVLQDVLNSIFPKILPLVVFFASYAMVKKGFKPLKIIGLLALVGAVLGLLGILA